MNHPPPPSDTPTRAAPHAMFTLVERLAEDMVRRWHEGERPVAEEYFDNHPELWQTPSASLELIAEELALRAEYQLPATEAELAGRFPEWRAQVLALLDCQIALGQIRPRFPETRESIGEFELCSELGRGSEGRVFLAEQPLLAGRLVVLKLSPLGSCEHLCLARLQHSHIVPLYSAHEFPERGLLGLCMPYFGGATLAAVFQNDQRFTSGQALLATLPIPAPAHPAPGSAWHVLHRASWPETVCWLGACLAEALAYAHERNLVHLDVKPSNVLLAGDGTPMLLDFHLAHPPVPAGQVAPEWLGGTPGFMSPEHQTAFDAVQAAKKIVTPIDGRADVFALGLVLQKMLTHGPDQPKTRGLQDILAKCTQPNPADRYPTAAALAVDLRRHLADLPLRGVRNRSLQERWAKWRRRQPHVLPVALSMLALLLAGVGLVIRSNRQVAQAETALVDGRTHFIANHYTEAASSFRSGEGYLDWLPFQRSLRTQLREGRIAAEREQVAAELRHLCASVRPLYAAEVLALSQAQAAAKQCRTIWNERERLAKQLEFASSAWRADLLDLGILTAHLECRAAGSSNAARRQALTTLAEAEALLGPSRALQLEQTTHANVLHMPPPTTPTKPPKQAWEHLALARSYYAAGNYADALAASNACLALEPSSFWGHYDRGLCLLALDRATEAIAAFSAATALAPTSAWCVYNRGVAYAKAGRLEPALADFDHALELDTRLAQAYLSRAGVRHRSQRFAEAQRDLDRAANAGLPTALVEYERALAFLSANERPDAIASLQRCLANDPNHAPAKNLLERLQGEKK